MSNYEQKPGEGVIFANDKTDNPNAPTMKGNFTDPSGKKMEIALWRKTSKAGQEYFSIKVQAARQ